MSLLGFDALGRLALGQLQQKTLTPIILTVTASGYTVTASAASFQSTENISPAAFVVAGQGVTLAELEAVAAASFAVSTTAPTFPRRLIIAPAALVVTASPTTEPEVGFIQSASFAITFADVPLMWTGPGVDTSYTGGVGHFLVALEDARQLARITRKTPQPIDRTTAPTFKPIGGPPMAPPAPAIDLQAIQNQRAEAAKAAAAQAATIKRRRQEEELLLLAS